MDKLLADDLGSSATVTRGNSGSLDGVVVGRERYAAFGERRRGEAPATTDFLYTAQRFNANAGLYHYSDGKSAGRYYDTLLGRFVQADPIIPGTGSQDLNRFSYAKNNPIRYNDPSGHCIDGITTAICVVVAANVALDWYITTNVLHQEYTWQDAAITATASVLSGGLAGGIAKTTGVAALKFGATKLAANAGINAVTNLAVNIGSRTAKEAIHGSSLEEAWIEATKPEALTVDIEAGILSGIAGPTLQKFIDILPWTETMYRVPPVEGPYGTTIQLGRLNTIIDDPIHDFFSYSAAGATDASPLGYAVQWLHGWLIPPSYGDQWVGLTP